MTTFTNTLKNRRSIYHLGRNVTLSNDELTALILSLIHISEPTRRTPISYAVFCLKKKKMRLSLIHI